MYRQVNKALVLSYNMQIDQIVGEMMKKVILTGLALIFSMAANAQEGADDAIRVVLPIEAQQCKLPSAPPPIPEAPVKDDLIQAQKKIKLFQEDVAVYLHSANSSPSKPFT